MPAAYPRACASSSARWRASSSSRFFFDEPEGATPLKSFFCEARAKGGQDVARCEEKRARLTASWDE